MRIEPSELPAPEILAQRVVGGALGRPVDALGIDLGAAAVEDADLLAREIAGIALHVRDDLFLDDRDRHRPGRIEVDRRDMRGDLRRGMIDVADDRGVAMDDRAVLDRFDRGRRQVDDDIALAEREVQIGEPARAGGELLRAHARRHVERLQRRAGDDAGLAQAHARLEALDRGGEAGVPCQRRSPSAAARSRSPSIARRRRSSATAGPLERGH